MPPGLEYAAFELSLGDVSEPLAFASDPSSTEAVYYLLMISEIADTREISEDFLPLLKAKALEGWLLEERESHEISYHGLKNGFDSETYAWINWQLSVSRI